MEIKNQQQQKSLNKRKILLIALTLILFLDLLSLLIHYMEQDSEQKYLEQLQAEIHIKLTSDKINLSSSQQQIVNPLQKLYFRQHYVTTKKIQQLQKNLEFYDFLSLTTHFKPRAQVEIIQDSYIRPNSNLQRNYLRLQLSQGQLQNIFDQMVKSKNSQQTKMKSQNLNKNYYYKLYNDPQNQKYLEFQYYHYDKLYKIGNFGYQLPLCVVLYSKNNQQTIRQTYQSIRRQNYTNFRLIHLDDNSKDDSINTVLQYLQNHKDFQSSITIIKQYYQKNKLHNINYGIINYCHHKDIIIQMNANQFLIGRQVFQLINTLYQTKRNTQNQLWSVYFGSIKCKQAQCPISSQQLEVSIDKSIENSLIETSLRVPRLRTYLKEIYVKINIKDFVDVQMVKEGQYFTTCSQLFIYQRILQMATFKHLLKIRELPYLYKYQPLNFKDIEYIYAQLSSKILPYYNPLKSLEEVPSRYNQSLILSEIFLRYQTSKQKIKQKRLILKNQIKQLYQKKNIDNTKNRGQYLDFIQESVVYNIQNSNQQFGKIPGLIINTSSLQKNFKNFKYKEYGLFYDIQVCTNYDYLNLTNKVNFTEVQKKLIESSSHQVLTFKFNKKLQKLKQKLQFYHFANEFQVQSFLDSCYYFFTHTKQYVKDKEFFIASLLSLSDITNQAKQLQYFYLNKKYGIQHNFQQIPICILSAGYNLFSQGRYKNLLNSLQRINYTNYKILWIDDNSSDNSAYNVYKYLKNTNMRIKNRIKIINNFQHLGIMANIHIYSQRYCGPDDVVVICDGDDSIIGIQTFQAINSIFKNPNYWYVYTRFLMKLDKKNKNKFVLGRSSKKLNISIEQYRTKINFWVTSHMRIFRRKVMDKVPIQHFIQYKYDQQQGIAWPRYQTSSADRFQVYSNMELSGNNRILFINDVFYKYDTSQPQQCYRYKELYEQYKSKLKRKLKPLKNLQAQIEFFDNQQTSPLILAKLKQNYQLYLRCQKK